MTPEERAAFEERWEQVGAACLSGSLAEFRRAATGRLPGGWINRLYPSDGKTALIRAIESASEDAQPLVEALRDRYNADFHTADADQNTPLGVAVRVGRVDVVRYLLDALPTTDPHCASGPDQVLPRHLALRHKGVVLQALVVALGTFGNAYSSEKTRELFERLAPSSSPAHADQVEELLREGADPNGTRTDEKDAYGVVAMESALNLAVRQKNDAALDLLLRFGASPSANEATTPPLIEAIECCNRFAVERLLLEGAGPDALHHAAAENMRPIIARLVKKGVDPNSGPEDLEESALHAALAHAHLGAALLLYRLGADPHARNEKGEFPETVTCAPGVLQKDQRRALEAFRKQRQKREAQATAAMLDAELSDGEKTLIKRSSKRF